MKDCRCPQRKARLNRAWPGLGDLVARGLGKLGIHPTPPRKRVVLNPARQLMTFADGPVRGGIEKTRRVSFPGKRTGGHFPFSAYGAAGGSGVVNAASLDDLDVQAAFSSILDDTVQVNLPAGTGHWQLQKSIVLPNGSGNFAVMGAGDLSLSNRGGGDITTIVHDCPTEDSNGFWAIETTSRGYPTLTRIAGLTITMGAVRRANNQPADQGFIKYIGYDQLRLDHCTFTHGNLGMATVFLYGPTGVMDHNVAESAFANVYETGSKGLFSNFADGPWARPTLFGGDGFLFLEDNTFGGFSSGFYDGGSSDLRGGSRLVLRYNTIGNVITHGNDEDLGRQRPGRAMEVYGNIFRTLAFGLNFTNPIFVSSGPNLIWGNTLQTQYDVFLTFHNNRSDDNGTDNPPRGFPAMPPPSNHAGQGDWGYCGSNFNGDSSEIDGNTDADGYPCIDQIGRGAGDLLANDFPSIINTATGAGSSNPLIYPRQGILPLYEWLNDVGATANFLYVYEPQALHENRDYYLDKGVAFTGASGVGSGVLAARPATCTPLVGYWATDQQTLYQCATPDAWTVLYTPYVYPHPLVGAPAAPVMPMAMFIR